MKPEVISVIMGGGRGRRLYPLTKLRCKPAVPLAGKYRLVDIPISNCLNSGLNRICVLTQFNTASLHRHIQQSYKFDPFGGGFVVILSAEQTAERENWYQGTADAVRQNLSHFGAADNDLFVVLSGDQLYRMDFRAILEQHLKSGADVTIAAKPFPLSQVGGLGLMRVNDDLQVAEFVEKPDDPKAIESLAISEKLQAEIGKSGGEKHCLASMGIYVFGKQTLFDALQSSSASDFGKEVIPGLLGKVELFGFIFDGYWEDIGTVGRFFEANLRLTDPVPPFDFFDPDNLIYSRARYLPASKIVSSQIDRAIVADGCRITESTLTRTVVGVRSCIGGGTHLHNVIVMGHDYFEHRPTHRRPSVAGLPALGIGKNCRIRNAIIDKNARIGNNVVLSPEGKKDGFECENVMVRDGVLMVAKEAIIADNTVI